MNSYDHLKVVVASPSDVKKERDSLEEIIKKVNTNIAHDSGLHLDVVRWENDAYAGFHIDGPQGLIDTVLKIEDCDIFIGIFWKKFGTPTKKDGMTGTEHEFKKAYEAWKNNKKNKPHIMIFFNHRKYFPANTKESEQQTAVLKFRENFPEEGLWWRYDGINNFKELVEGQIIRYLKNCEKEPKSRVPVSIDSKVPKFPENPVFIGRKEYIDNKIKNLLKNPGSRVSIVGIGGSGKSQLAFKALHQYYKEAITDLVVVVYLSEIASTISTEDNYHDKSNRLTVLSFRRFLDAIGSELIKQSILQISEQDFEQLDIKKCKSIVYNALETKKHPILYCDNFETLSNAVEEERKGDNNEEIKEIFNFLNKEISSNASILVTSRNVKNFLSKENRINLKGLKIEEGMQVFIEHASTYQQHFSNPDNKKTKFLKTLITKTDGHPLSIEILAKTYEGGGEEELQTMSETLGKQRDNPLSSEERHENLYKCFNYSIERLDESLKMLLPKTTILHSPFPSEAVEKIFGIQESRGLLVALYNKSLLSRMEGDEYGSFNDKFWLYSLHSALRNYLEDKYKDLILKIETESLAYFYNYYYNLVKSTYDAWRKDDHKDFIRQFVQMTKSENNDYDRAIEFATNIGRKEKLGKQNGAVIATHLGLIYRELGYYDRSLVYHKKALEIHQALEDRVGMAIDYGYMGLVYHHKGQLDDALQYHKKALEIHQALEDRVSMARAYGNMGLVYYSKGQLDDALQYHKKALEIDESLGDRVGMAIDYNDMGLVYDSKGQLDDALQYHKKALEIHQALEDRVGMAIDYGYMGMGYYSKGQLDDALQYHKKALEIQEALGDWIWMAATNYGNMGRVYYSKGQSDDALQYLKKALEIQEVLGDRVGMARAYGNMGLVYYSKGQLDDALQYHKKALEIQEVLEDRVGISKDYANMGRVYYSKGQLDDALQYHKKALEIQEVLGDRVGMARAYGNMGLVYYSKGELDDALQYHKKALEIDESLGDIVNLVQDYCNIGNVYLAKSDKNQSIIAANNAFKIVKEFEDTTGNKHLFANKVEELISLLKVKI